MKTMEWVGGPVISLVGCQVSLASKIYAGDKHVD